MSKRVRRNSGDCIYECMYVPTLEDIIIRQLMSRNYAGAPFWGFWRQPSKPSIETLREIGGKTNLMVFGPLLLRNMESIAMANQFVKLAPEYGPYLTQDVLTRLTETEKCLEETDKEYYGWAQGGFMWNN